MDDKIKKKKSFSVLKLFIILISIGLLLIILLGIKKITLTNRELQELTVLNREKIIYLEHKIIDISQQAISTNKLNQKVLLLEDKFNKINSTDPIFTALQLYNNRLNLVAELFNGINNLDIAIVLVKELKDLIRNTENSTQYSALNNVIDDFLQNAEKINIVNLKNFRLKLDKIINFLSDKTNQISFNKSNKTEDNSKITHKLSMQEFLSDSWNELKSLIKIRRSAKEYDHIAVSIDDKINALNITYMYLIQASWSLEKHNYNNLFDNILKAKNILERIYLSNDTDLKELIEDINELLEARREIVFPNFKDILLEMRKITSKRGDKDA